MKYIGSIGLISKHTKTAGEFVGCEYTMLKSLINQAGRVLHQPPGFEANPFSCAPLCLLHTPSYAPLVSVHRVRAKKRTKTYANHF